jgi:hypothetical protein
VPPELQRCAAGLRVLVLPATQLGKLADLAWSLSQHPRTRFVVLANSMEGGGMAVGDLAAMLSGGPSSGGVLRGTGPSAPPLLPPLPCWHAAAGNVLRTRAGTTTGATTVRLPACLPACRL